MLARLLTACSAATLATAASAAPLLNLTFEGDTVGAVPAGITVNTPATPSSPGTPFGALANGNVGSLVIAAANNTVHNSGKAWRVFDYSGATSSPANQNNSVTIPLSAGTDNAIVSFRFTAGPSLVINDGNTFLRLSFGGSALNAASSSSGSTGNFGRVAFSSINNTSGFTAANVVTDVAQVNPAESASNLVQLFINRKTTPLNYNAPDSTTKTLLANSYQVWFNGVQLTAGAANGSGNFSMHNSTTNVSHLSFGSGGGQTGGDWVIDSVTASAIPEPAALGLAALGATLMLSRRRARA